LPYIHLVYHASPLLSFNGPAPTEIYTLSLHDALPIYRPPLQERGDRRPVPRAPGRYRPLRRGGEICKAKSLSRCGRDRALQISRSEEHTSELQSRENLVCRLLLEKKK